MKVCGNVVYFDLREFLGSAATRKHTIVGQKYFKGEQTYVWGGTKIY